MSWRCRWRMPATRCVAVNSGAAAFSRLSSGERIDIIVSDLTMPVMDGLALIKTAQAQRPNLPAVLLTGYAGEGANMAIGVRSAARFPCCANRFRGHNWWTTSVRCWWLADRQATRNRSRRVIVGIPCSWAHCGLVPCIWSQCCQPNCSSQAEIALNAHIVWRMAAPPTPRAYQRLWMMEGSSSRAAGIPVSPNVFWYRTP